MSLNSFNYKLSAFSFAFNAADCLIDWQLFVTAIGYWHGHEVLIHQQLYWYNSRQRNSSYLSQ